MRPVRVKPAPRKEKLHFQAHIWYKVTALSGCRIMALLQLPKLITRVRFPSPAPIKFSSHVKRVLTGDVETEKTGPSGRFFYVRFRVRIIEEKTRNTQNTSIKPRTNPFPQRPPRLDLYRRLTKPGRFGGYSVDYIKSVGIVTTSTPQGGDVNSRFLISQIIADGWYLVRIRGSHHHFKHRTKPGLVTVPHPKKDLLKKTAISILQQALL